jgi:hypothetical protein
MAVLQYIGSLLKGKKRVQLKGKSYINGMYYVFIILKAYNCPLSLNFEKRQK